MFDSMRIRLTLWYTGVLALVLVAFSLGVYTLLARNLYRRLDGSLLSTVEGTALLLAREKAEGEVENLVVMNALEEAYFPRQAVAIFAVEGQLLAEKPLPGNIHAQLSAAPQSITETRRFYSLPGPGADDDGYRVAVQKTKPTLNEQACLIVVTQPLDSVAEELELLRDICAAARLEHSHQPIKKLPTESLLLATSQYTYHFPISRPVSL